jgi:hypothetical protein
MLDPRIRGGLVALRPLRGQRSEELGQSDEIVGSHDAGKRHALELRTRQAANVLALAAERFLDDLTPAA